MFNAKEALLCVFKRLNFARQAVLDTFCARQFLRGSFSSRVTLSLATPGLRCHKIVSNLTIKLKRYQKDSGETLILLRKKLKKF